MYVESILVGNANFYLLHMYSATYHPLRLIYNGTSLQIEVDSMPELDTGVCI